MDSDMDNYTSAAKMYLFKWENESFNSTADTLPVDVFQRYDMVRFLEIHAPVAVLIDRSITPIWYSVGITGNAVSAMVWMQKLMRLNNSSALYLAALSMTDLLFLLLHILQELKYAWGYDTLSYPGLCEIYFVLYLASQTLSPLIVLGFSLERWIAVCHPFYKENYCTHKRAATVIIVLLFIALCMCSIQAYFWTYNKGHGQCTVRQSVLAGGERSLWSVYTWVTEIMAFFLVPAVILALNVMVIREVRSISRNGQRYLGSQVGGGAGALGTAVTTTIMLLSVSFFVIATTVPATVMYVMALTVPYGNTRMTDAQIHTDVAWQKYVLYMTVRKVVDEICLSHYACKFFQYLITGKHFRRCVRELFRRGMRSVAVRRKYSGVSMENTWHKTHTSRV